MLSSPSGLFVAENKETKESWVVYLQRKIVTKEQRVISVTNGPKACMTHTVQYAA